MILTCILIYIIPYIGLCIFNIVRLEKPFSVAEILFVPQKGHCTETITFISEFKFIPLVNILVFGTCIMVVIFCILYQSFYKCSIPKLGKKIYNFFDKFEIK